MTSIRGGSGVKAGKPVRAYGQGRGPGTGWWGNPAARALVWQALLAIAVVSLFAWAGRNVVANLRASNITWGFGFLAEPASFDITGSLIPFQAGDSYGRALMAGFGNTLTASLTAIVIATALGFVVGVARLSHNALVARFASAYVEVLRNTPLLLQLLVWYNVVLKSLPVPRQSIALPGGLLLNNRGLYSPWPVATPGWTALGAGLLAALALWAGLAVWSARRRRAGKPPLALWLVTPLILAGLPLAAVWLTTGSLAGALPLAWPELRGFNVSGGVTLLPEFVALVLGLSLYTSAFIAEIVRSGVQSVPKGQREAGRALGLGEGQILRLIVIPQALRLIIPPLTGQYLNLTKNSSLAVAVGYPDLVSIGAGPVLQNTGQALEVISLIMLIYLAVSLLTALLMNWWNARMALVER
ncbi:amino acid ABC transporter permease [Camelimonas sp. ID_303_24]